MDTSLVADGTPMVTAETNPQEVVPPEAVEQDLLVEDVSIDGMCGVY